jgi:hypothetical protein
LGRGAHFGILMFPKNQQLWESIRARVKASHGGKNSFYVNQAASDEYAREGGEWVDNKSQADPRFIDKQKEAKDKLKRKQQEQKRRQNRGWVR